MNPSYGMTREFDGVSMEQAEERITASLKEVGFGILTEIDVKATFKKKIDKDFRPYKILGACNPNLAFEALGAEESIGLLLPCNVVVAEDEKSGKTVVTIINPAAMLDAVELDASAKDTLHRLMTTASAKLSTALEKA